MSNKPLENAEDILRVHGKPYRKTARVRAVQMKELFTVRTKNGTLFGKAGDWLVHNEDASPSIFVMEGFIFERTYGEVS